MRLALFCAIFLFASMAAHAAESAPVTTARDTATLVSEPDTVAPGQPLRLGLRLRMAPGWHTYWSNPGDAGAPPTITVTGATAGPFNYPVPERQQDGVFTSYEYTGDLLLPVTVTGAKPGTIEAHATWLICADICVPEEGRFSLSLPAGPGTPGAQAALFRAAEARMPRASPFAAHVSPDGVLWLEAPDLSIREARFFPAEPGVIDHGAAQTLGRFPQGISLALKPLKTLTRPLAGLLQLTDTGGQVENLTVTAPLGAMPPALAARTPAGLPQALLLAFLGGMILNLMPCVLPVLAMKALALSRMCGADRAHVRREAAVYTLGVVTAFCAIGGITLLARAAGGAAGDAAGWGVQFQSAAFTTATGWLLFAVGLNMSGVFMVGAQLAGAGHGLAARGSFFTGLLAVVVATPCTAPFMGVALAAAFAMPPAAGMMIFVALGLGLAAPYAALALSPGAARLLPRPGAWMDVLKQLLAFPMYGAALWMVWVASQQTDASGLAAVFASFLLVALAAWAYGLAQTRRQAGANGRVLRAMAGASAAAGLALLAAIGLAAPAARAAGGPSADGSEPYSAARLAELRARHRPVLVDMSAAWCVTCLVNERVALTPRAVRDAFTHANAVYLRGDWTSRDGAITAFLRQHDRTGVPLYVFYPASGEEEVLPQILTPGLVLERLKAGV